MPLLCIINNCSWSASSKYITSAHSNHAVEQVWCICAAALTTNPIPRPADAPMEPHRVPACASWFNYNLVHQHEKRLLPEFFNDPPSKMTPVVRPGSVTSCSISCDLRWSSWLVCVAMPCTLSISTYYSGRVPLSWLSRHFSTSSDKLASIIFHSTTTPVYLVLWSWLHLCGQSYHQHRNAILDKYREDSSRTLSLEAACSAIAADRDAVQRIWGFLDSWGIINFQARDGAARPPQDLKLHTAAEEGAALLATVQVMAGADMRCAQWPWLFWMSKVKMRRLITASHL